MNTKTRLPLGILWVAMLAGCGQKEEATDTAVQKPRQQTSQSSADPFVKAVTVTVGESAVELRFELPERPLPKQAIPLHLRLTGLLDSTALTVKLASNDHLKIVSGAEWALDTLPAGQAQEHDVTVSADATGIFVVDATVQFTRDNFAKTFAYAIPVAVTDPAASTAVATSSAAASSAPQTK